MKTRRSFLSVLYVIPLLSLDLSASGCSGVTPAMILSDIEAGIADAQIAIQTVLVGVDAYFAAHPNPKLQGEIDAAAADVAAALRVVTSAAAGATNIADGNVQAALAAFATAYNALMTLVAQIGVQTAPSGMTTAAKVNGITYVPAPRLLQLVKTAPAPAMPAMPAAKDKLIPAPAIK